jgi:erythromycin esterase-like protein
MKNFFLLIFLIFLRSTFYSQTTDSITENIISEIPENVRILGLGDPTHQESTITEYRIDSIKKLCLQKDFSIIALEGNIYELYRAHQDFLKDNDISHYEKAMYAMLNSREMEELYQFVYDQNTRGNQIYIVGFDPSFSGKTFTKQIKLALEKNRILSNGEKKDFFKTLEKANVTNIMALFRNNKKVKSKIVNYSNKLLSNYKAKTLNEKFLSNALNNLKYYYSQEEVPDKRDVVMAKNIEFLQDVFPGEKIILFGSSTHLLKNPKQIKSDFFQNQRTTTLGNELYKIYKYDYYFIGYTALSGNKSNIFNNDKRLDDLELSSIEYKVSKQMTKASLFISEKSYPLQQEISSRFLGYTFFPVNRLWEVMDGLVLIENVEPSQIKKLKD